MSDNGDSKEDLQARIVLLEMEVFELKAIEKSLRMEEEKLKGAQKIASIFCWELKNLTNKVVLTVEAAKSLKTDVQSVSKMSEFLALIHPQDREEFYQSFNAAISKKQHFEMRHRFLLHDGVELVASHYCFPTYGPSGDILSVTGLVRDITEESHQGQELAKAHMQLLKSEKMAALGNMVKGVAHELNTPIGVSITAISFLQEESERMAELLAQQTMTKTQLTGFLSGAENLARSISTSLHKAAELVQLFKQVSVEQHQDIISTFNLHHNFADIVHSFKHEFKNKNIQIINEVPTDIMLDSFPGVFFQIFTNLLNNAKQHAFDGIDKGEIVLRAEQKPDCLVIKFADSGTGMTDEVKQHLFDAFFTTKRGQGGTGLGMSIVYTLITEKLAGEVELESELGKGTCLTIRLPNRLADASENLGGLPEIKVKGVIK